MFLASIIMAANLLWVAIPLGAAVTASDSQPAAITEQVLQRRAAYSRDSTPGEQVRYLLQHYFVDPVPEEILNKDSIDEMIRLVNDPHTSFMTVAEYDSFISPEVIGIGIYIEGIPEGILVRSLIQDSPAAVGGLQVDDIIIRVKEHQEESWISLTGLSVDQGSSYIRGPVGSMVDLEVRRGAEILYFTLSRERIQSPPVVTSLPDPTTALIEVNTFLNNEGQPPTAVQFAEAIYNMESVGVLGYILDLCDNGGGYVYNALDIAGFFIGDRTAILVGSRQEPEKATKQELIISKPLLVLINQNTASASEILAAALKDNDRALFLGQKSYGKGCMQSIYPIYDGGELYAYLKITTNRFYTPQGDRIDEVGIAPDIRLNQTDLLPAARLLLSTTGLGESNRGSETVKLINGKQEYRIDARQARQQEYWRIYSEIIDNVGSTHFLLPKGSDWVQASAKQLLAKWPFYYPGYRPLPAINKRPNEPTYISFSHAIDPTSICEQVVELREKESGERLGLDLGLIEPHVLRLFPQKPLQVGREYWLSIHPGDNGVRSDELQLTLSKGYMTEIMVP